MAGTLTISTLSDGTNSTSSTNCIKGSAKAWVQFTGSSGAVNGSFNVGSVTRTAAGQWTVNFTTAMANANYSLVTATNQTSNGTNYLYINYGALSTSSCNIFMTPSGSGGGGLVDTGNASVVIFGA